MRVAGSHHTDLLATSIPSKGTSAPLNIMSHLHFYMKPNGKSCIRITKYMHLPTLSLQRSIVCPTELKSLPRPSICTLSPFVHCLMSMNLVTLSSNVGHFNLSSFIYFHYFVIFTEEGIISTSLHNIQQGQK